MRRVATLVLLAAISAGCGLTGGGGGKATITASELPKLVLQPGDLPSVFSRFDEGRQGRADQPFGERGDMTRFGREDGWKSRYRRPGSPATRGALVIESRADRFESSSGARKDLDANLPSQYDELPKPKLGDEARAMTLLQGPAGTGVRFYLVAWRKDNLTASISINGFDGKMTLQDALSLARKQQQRIAAAASS